MPHHQQSRRVAGVLLATVALLGAACSGETATTDTTEAAAVATTAPVAAPTGTEPTTTGATSTDAPTPAGDFFADPRGQLFADFQQTFDRSHPFGGLESYCLPHDEAADRIDTDPGLTADSVHVHHLDLDLDRVIEIGFAADVGDYRGMLNAFADEINETCGGVRGRQLSIGISSFSPLSPDVLSDANAACLEATEDNNAVFVVNFTSIQEPATLCVVEEHDTGMLTTTGFSDEAMNRGENRLFTVTPTWERALTVMVRTAHEQGRLEGKTIGIVASDLPGHTEVVQRAVIGELEALGYDVPVQEFLGCGGGTTCADGLQGAVSNLLDEGVDAVFPHLNLLSLPGFVQEMGVQGYRPDEVDFFNTGFNSQAGDLVSSKVSANGGPEAAALYNGAFLVDASDGGYHNVEGAILTPFHELCADVYEGRSGIRHDVFNPAENSPSGMTTIVCAFVRAIARAIYDAGDNPSRVDVYNAFANLGPIDAVNMLPNSFTPGSQTGPTAFQTMTWTSPCQFGLDRAFDVADTCVVPNGDWFIPG